MRLIKVSFSSIYEWSDDAEKKQKANDEQAVRAEQVKRIVGEPNVEAGSYASYDGLILSEDQYFTFISEGVKFSETSVINILQGAEVFKRADNRSNITPSHERAFNQLVNVHVANGALLTYDTVELLEDACTDELQRHLNQGWRIIAACVQPDGRRPDYILGKRDA